MRNVKVVFFDLYNTLIYLPIDTNPYAQLFRTGNINNSGELLLAKHVALTEDFADLNKLAEKLKLDVPEREVQKISTVIEREIQSAKIFEEVLPVLLELRKRGVKTGIISNLATPYKKPVFSLGLNNFVDKIFFSCELGCQKPEKEIFDLACDQMAIDPRQGLMVGDSLISDYRGGINAGMNALLLNRSMNKVDVLCISNLMGIFNYIR